MELIPASLLSEARDFSGQIFRCYYTSFPEKNLFADLGFGEHDEAYHFILNEADAHSGVDHAGGKLARPLVYGENDHLAEWLDVDQEVLLPLRRNSHSRFSDGSFGVWYGAKDEDTAVRESLFWACRYAEEELLQVDVPHKTENRKLIKVHVACPRAIDLHPHATSWDLCSDDYAFCNALGVFARQHGLDLFLSPSARSPGGVCTPVFAHAPLKTYTDYCWYTFQIKRGGKVKLIRHDKIYSTRVQL